MSATWQDEEVRVVRTEDEANRLLSLGLPRWFLLDVKVTGEGVLEKFHYVLVRRGML